jgi:hypothetical protein
MSDISWDVLAQVDLKKTEEGGRLSATPEKQFRCMAKIGDAFFDCVLLLEELGPIAPGFSGEIPIKFTRFDLVKPKIEIGTVFLMKELREIGSGKVMAINP